MLDLVCPECYGTSIMLISQTAYKYGNKSGEQTNDLAVCVECEFRWSRANDPEPLLKAPDPALGVWSKNGITLIKSEWGVSVYVDPKKTATWLAIKIRNLIEKRYSQKGITSDGYVLEQINDLVREYIQI